MYRNLAEMNIKRGTIEFFRLCLFTYYYVLNLDGPYWD